MLSLSQYPESGYRLPLYSGYHCIQVATVFRLPLYSHIFSFETRAQFSFSSCSRSGEKPQYCIAWMTRQNRVKIINDSIQNKADVSWLPFYAFVVFFNIRPSVFCCLFKVRRVKLAANSWGSFKSRQWKCWHWRSRLLNVDIENSDTLNIRHWNLRH